jgi:hypothetical protein
MTRRAQTILSAIRIRPAAEIRQALVNVSKMIRC